MKLTKLVKLITYNNSVAFLLVYFHKLVLKNSLIIHEQNTNEIIAMKESLCVMKHTCIFTNPRFSRLIQHLY